MDYSSIPQADWDAGGYVNSLGDGGWGKFDRGINAYFRRKGLDTGCWKSKQKRHGHTNRTDQRHPSSVEA